MSNWPDARIAMIDVETTGIDPTCERIVEIAVAVGESRQVVSRHSWLVNPGIPIPAAATQVHGITNEMVRCEGISLRDALVELDAVIAGSVVAAYNAPFDNEFITGPAMGLDVPCNEWRDSVWLDPLVWAKEAQKYERSKKLGAVAERLGVPVVGQAHRATADAETALHVLYALRRPSAWADWGRRQGIADADSLRTALGTFFPADLDACIEAQERLRAEQEADFKAWQAKQERQVANG